MKGLFMSDLLSQIQVQFDGRLRDEIEAARLRHQNAIDRVKAALASDQAANALAIVLEYLGRDMDNRARVVVSQGTNRERLFRALESGTAIWWSIERLVEETRLTEPQVRALVNDPDLRAVVGRQRVGKRKEYRSLRPADASQPSLSDQHGAPKSRKKSATPREAKPHPPAQIS